MLRCDGPAPGSGRCSCARSFRARSRSRLEYEREPAFREPGDTQRLEPRELFAQYYRHRYGSDIGEPLMKLFDELFEEVTGASA